MCVVRVCTHQMARGPSSATGGTARGLTQRSRGHAFGCCIEHTRTYCLLCTPDPRQGSAAARPPGKQARALATTTAENPARRSLSSVLSLSAVGKPGPPVLPSSPLLPRPQAVHCCASAPLVRSGGGPRRLPLTGSGAAAMHRSAGTPVGRRRAGPANHPGSQAAARRPAAQPLVCIAQAAGGASTSGSSPLGAPGSPSSPAAGSPSSSRPLSGAAAGPSPRSSTSEPWVQRRGSGLLVPPSVASIPAPSTTASSAAPHPASRQQQQQLAGGSSAAAPAPSSNGNGHGGAVGHHAPPKEAVSPFSPLDAPLVYIGGQRAYSLGQRGREVVRSMEGWAGTELLK